MSVAEILKSKGSKVITIEPGMNVGQLAIRLHQVGVGALVVTDAAGKVVGIISERDIVRGLAEHGGHVNEMPVRDLMTSSVVTCCSADDISKVAATMTRRRIRHLPVVDDGRLVGMVSIGDVLKTRIDEVQLEANVLRDVALAVR